MKDTNGASIFERPLALSPARRRIAAAYLEDETAAVGRLLEEATVDATLQARITARARTLVQAARTRLGKQGGIDAFLREYDLSSEEGVLLLCLAEALLRIPDAATSDRLIREKLTQADWTRHLGQSDSLLVNAATWGLMLTGRMVRLDTPSPADLGERFGQLVARSGEPVVRTALKEAMRILGHQFVFGRTIEEAIARRRSDAYAGYRVSFDILGEAALTQEHTERYFEAYDDAITVLAAGARMADAAAATGLSIKLSALHPRFAFAQRERLNAELWPRLIDLVRKAAAAGLAVTIDTEEADRLDVTLDAFDALLQAPALTGYEGLGIAVQAYQKRAPAVIDWLVESARAARRRIQVRLVKGAYWDSEIKRAQERGLTGYPVFTRKANTDVSYLACAMRLLSAPDACYPQFATHNAHTAAAVIELAGERPFEMQRLHGMGEALYDSLRAENEPIACRVYAPVGAHAELLPYLVRRLLENGANTSFVNRLEDTRRPVESLVADPVAIARSTAGESHPRVPQPVNLYLPERQNSEGINFCDPVALEQLHAELRASAKDAFRATPLVDGKVWPGTSRSIVNPANNRQVVGEVVEVDAEGVHEAMRRAADASAGWQETPVPQRAQMLQRAADLMESHRAELMLRCVREGGRTLADAAGEVREAVDYARYYAAQARKLFAERELPGPVGERNRLSLHGRGVFACISPWNFPLAIFAGQVLAALVSGNTVVAKPARQTPLVAMRIVELLHEAGVPTAALQFVPGASGVVGEALTGDAHLAGVVFTGSTETARSISQRLAARDGSIVPLIAETGGVNAMIVDSSALPEQVVADVLQSAFNSAGQRCSALRLLCLQRDVADRVLDMLRGAMAELHVGDPALLHTDVGPVIDSTAKEMLHSYIEQMKASAKLVAETPLSRGTGAGSFVAPIAFEIDDPRQLAREVFGPVLHVVRYDAAKLDGLIDAINATGYGLTLGIHSRVTSIAERIRRRARVGNVYVNRNMIGAMVGVQPFGGEGRSGTGPKAGGPNYLRRFVVERTYSENTAALGGDPSLLSLED